MNRQYQWIVGLGVSADVGFEVIYAKKSNKYSTRLSINRKHVFFLLEHLIDELRETQSSAKSIPNNSVKVIIALSSFDKEV